MDPTTTTIEVVCYEDDPCWDCSTMGNMVCGPPPHGVDAEVGIGTALVIERQPDGTEVRTELPRTGADASLAGIGLMMIGIGLILVRRNA